jgi:ATP-binding cassette subfamily B protein
MGRQSRAAREADYCARVATTPAAAKEVRVFGLGGFFAARFRDRFAAATGEVRRLRLRTLRRLGALSALRVLGVAGGFWLLLPQGLLALRAARRPGDAR